MRKKMRIWLVCLLLIGMLSLMACGSVKGYTINFYVDDELYDSVKISQYDTIVVPNDPKKDGYIFEGWYWDNDTWYSPYTADSLLNVSIEKNMNLYAKFTKPCKHTPSEWTIVNKPTCLKAGLEKIYCLNCDVVLETREVSALGHKFGDWYVAKDSTVYKDGLEERVCSVCNYCDTKIIPSVDTIAPTEITIDNGVIKWNGGSKFGFKVIVNGSTYVVNENELDAYLYSDNYNNAKVAGIKENGELTSWVELNNFVVNAPVTYLRYEDDGTNVTFTWDSPSDLYDYTFVVGETENTIDKSRHSYTVARNILESGMTVSVYVQGLETLNFYPSKKKTITLQQLDAPNLFIDKLDIKWNGVVGAICYKVEALTTETTTNTSYSYDGASAGEHTITVTVFGEDSLNNTSTLTFNKLVRPEITIENNVVSWNAIVGQIKYATLINDNEITFVKNFYTIPNTEDDIYLYAYPVQSNTMQSDWVIISKFTYGEYSTRYYGSLVKDAKTYSNAEISNTLYVPIEFENYDFSNIDSQVTLIARKCPSTLTKTLVVNIIIPNGTTKIEASAFSGCSNATGVSVPDSVASIGDEVFYGCTGLTKVYITDLDKWASIDFNTSYANPLYSARKLYLNGTQVTNATLTDATKVSTYAFYYCTSLTRITIPEKVTSIGNFAFYGCTSLTNITIPESMTSIGNFAFGGGTSLTGVYITDLGKWASISFGNIASNPLYSAKNFYLNGTQVTNVILTDATKISAYAFCNCTSLTSIKIPENATSIGDSTFDGCTSLTSITIPENVMSIGEGAFRNCTSLTSVTIPERVTSIGYRAFDGCISLTSITIPENVTSVGSSAFSCCTSLKIVTFVENSKCESIGGFAFFNCTSLTSITIPESATSIGDYAFSQCKALETINYNAISCTDLSSLNDVFYEAGQSGDGIIVNIGANAKRIPAYLFDPSRCSPKITSVVFAENSKCESIGYSAFGGCTSLTGVYITDLDKWVSIDFNTSYANPLYYAKNLYLNGTLVTDATLVSARMISAYAFENCTSLTSITIPESVTSIGHFAFGGCISLTSITIPESVTSIGYSAFCTSLTRVYYEGGVSDWDKISIDSYNSNLTNATRYYYSEEEPTTDGNYWHYVDGLVTEWESKV